MEVTQRYILDEFIRKHTILLKPLNKWLERIESAHWMNHNELRADFPDADFVTNSRYVFNLKGNNYRIVAVVLFFAGELNIRFVGTHSEYDKIQARTI